MLVVSGLVLLGHLGSANSIEQRFREIELGSAGALGAAIITPYESHYNRRNERFSLQSVMKLIVAMVALDEVDKGRWRFDKRFQFTQSDVSISVQPLTARLGKRKAMTTSLQECVELTVTQSCSASGDFLIRQFGGFPVIRAFFRKNNIQGISLDRQERQLQTDVVGLKYKLAFHDGDAFEAAIKKQSMSVLDAAYRKYQNDPRDTTTPEAMGDLLRKLVEGKLLSRKSTDYLLGVMERTQTGPDRLKAGIPAGWRLGHKTGTSSSHRGVSCATNDVGIVRNSAGEWKIIVALLRNSKLDSEGRASVLRQTAEAAFIE